jgi:flagellar export protein FliJ
MLKDRLERIIEIKEKMLEDKEREIGEETGKLDAVNRQMDMVTADIEKNYERTTTESMMGNDFSVIKDYVEYLENIKCTLVGERESIEEKIAFLKSDLIDLMKEKKMLGTLREKILSELKKSSNRREQKLLDDIALRIEEKKL